MSRHEQVKFIINDWYSTGVENAKKKKLFHEGNGLPLDAGKIQKDGNRSVPTMLTTKTSQDISQ